MNFHFSGHPFFFPFQELMNCVCSFSNKNNWLILHLLSKKNISLQIIIPNNKTQNTKQRNDKTIIALYTLHLFKFLRLCK